MVGKKTKSLPGGQVNETQVVDDFLAKLKHLRKAQIKAVRAVILGADSRVGESIKWNAPSFFTTEHFATFKLRPVDTVQVIFHTGAKVKPTVSAVEIDDSGHILQWVAPDRCLATFADMQDIRAKETALAMIVRQWIEQM